MEEKCRLENILTLTKSLTMIYINGVIESSNEKTRKVMLDGLDNSLDLQDELYQSMKENGYYQVCNVESKEINKTLSKLTKDED